MALFKENIVQAAKCCIKTGVSDSCCECSLYEADNCQTDFAIAITEAVESLDKNECIYCAVNSDGEIQWVEGSSSKNRYFRTNKYLANAVKYHNERYPEDKWTVKKFSLVEM